MGNSVRRQADLKGVHLLDDGFHRLGRVLTGGLEIRLGLADPLEKEGPGPRSWVNHPDDLVASFQTFRNLDAVGF